MPESEIVAWCPDDKWWLPADEIGRSCASAECPRTLVKRRMYVCREFLGDGIPDTCMMAMSTKQRFLEHECGSAY